MTKDDKKAADAEYERLCRAAHDAAVAAQDAPTDDKETA